MQPVSTTGTNGAATAPLASSSGAMLQSVSGRAGEAFLPADPATNTLIVTAPEAVYRQLRPVIDKLDVRRAQVYIESLIVEVTSDQAAQFGIQWLGGQSTVANGGKGVVGGTNFGGAGQNILGAAQNIATLGPGLNVGVVDGQISLPGVGTITNLSFLARALEQTAKANVLSTPTILTLDNEEARIVVGQNVPFITGQYLNPASAGGATVNPFQTIERRDVGLTLRVRPQISEGGTIKLVIYQEVSSVQDTAGSAGVITNKRSIETNVLVDDGSIVALGGLIEDKVSNAIDKVPLLGDIPVLGQLFRYETRKHQKTNLMVFLRPTVIRDEKAARAAAVKPYERMRELEQKTAPEKHLVLPDMPPPVVSPSDAPGGGGTVPDTTRPGNSDTP